MTDLMWGLLYLDKKLTQRRLALQVALRLKKQGDHISVETIQRSFAGTQEYVQAVIKQALERELSERGLISPLQIKRYVNKYKEQARHDHRPISCEQVNKLVALWVLKSAVKSKRVLAKSVRENLVARGYDYRLGSVQNIFSHKVRETKQVVFDVLKSLLIAKFYRSETVFARDWAEFSTEDVAKFSVISASRLEKACQDFLQKNKQWSKRGLAKLLAKDLLAAGYKISHHSLQYALAGKRQGVRQIVYDQLLTYMLNPPRAFAKPKLSLTADGRQQNAKLNIIYARLKKSKDERTKVNLSRSFLTARQNELKKLWERRRRVG